MFKILTSFLNSVSPGDVRIVRHDSGEAFLSRITLTYPGNETLDEVFVLEDSSGYAGEYGIRFNSKTDLSKPDQPVLIDVWLSDVYSRERLTAPLVSLFTVRCGFRDRREVIAIKPGATINLETQALALCAIVTEVVYTDGTQNQIESLTIDFEVWGL